MKERKKEEKERKRNEGQKERNREKDASMHIIQTMWNKASSSTNHLWGIYQKL